LPTICTAPTKNDSLKMKKLLIALAALTISMSAFSQTTSFGRPDCGQWVTAKGQNSTYKSWLLGFVSGLNYMYDNLNLDNKAVPNHLDKVSSAQQIYVWVDKFCQENPLKTVSDAGSTLMIELITK